MGGLGGLGDAEIGGIGGSGGPQNLGVKGFGGIIQEFGEGPQNWGVGGHGGGLEDLGWLWGVRGWEWGGQGLWGLRIWGVPLPWQHLLYFPPTGCELPLDGPWDGGEARPPDEDLGGV